MARAAKATELKAYRAKRDFERTPEPSDAASPAHAGLAFVVQKHAARRLHYDVRLELDGVLLSWAVPKGPSMDPRQRRLAVRTEDHPLAYADFEGDIPKGQYGGGHVEIWDRGTWQPEGDAEAARAGLAAGKLTFRLDGGKLRGRWHLVRTKPQGKQESWLLFKGRDDAGPSDAAATVRALVAQLPLGFALTNLDKVLYPEQGLTKAQLIAYLAVVADRMLPHVAARPLTLVRCPDGRGRSCFFQKHLGAGSPPAIEPLAIRDGDDGPPYMTVRDLAGLVATAQLGALETHTWGARAPDIEHPDVLVIDLDPDAGLAWERVALAAFEVRRRLGDLGLDSFVKTTGGKGLHVVVPLEPAASWSEVKAFTKAIADRLERDDPGAYTANPAKARRRGRIFVDYLRNGRGATFIAPYSPRAREGATVATPIAWDELATGVTPDAFTIATVPPRIATVADPWASYASVRQRLR